MIKKLSSNNKGLPKNLKSFLEKLTVREVTPNPSWFSSDYKNRIGLPKTGLFFSDLNRFSDLVLGEFVRFNIGGYNGDTYVCKIIEKPVYRSEKEIKDTKDNFYSLENESSYFFPCTKEQLESIIKYGTIINPKNENTGTNDEKITLWFDGKTRFKVHIIQEYEFNTTLPIELKKKYYKEITMDDLKELFMEEIEKSKGDYIEDIEETVNSNTCFDYHGIFKDQTIESIELDMVYNIQKSDVINE